MRIVCDSGSTKADWIVYDQKDEIFTSTTRGINPVFHNKAFIHKELEKELVKEVACQEIEKIYFYGAGCWDERLKSVISGALSEVFPNTEIDVHFFALLFE